MGTLSDNAKIKKPLLYYRSIGRSIPLSSIRVAVRRNIRMCLIRKQTLRKTTRKFKVFRYRRYANKLSGYKREYVYTEDNYYTYRDRLARFKFIKENK